ncbi:16S rRNA (cytidine(1402)-2'-O)-methyltransferase [Gemella cuniculi]|uniref:16S rRNA (cytidine(1402)-2'-O)-methyltransferase n=1 Tax=Gemella cuniculi TaxID=150240 RepID=UPI0004076052|nr:16S rRNA (cytidine(1402)-2'-O)-methyltransferase [Gemella cuniculi]
MLYLVATPIGNLEDITLRALRVLKNVDIIACEDTRNTQKLLNHYEITGKQLLSYHEHNEEKMSDKIIEYLKENVDVALVTDAGMPCISDPGYILINKIKKEGLSVTALPGANAGLTALISSGIESYNYTFYGFLPRKTKELRNKLENILNSKTTGIIYESPYRIKNLITELVNIEPTREISIARELTKMFEQIETKSAQEVLEMIGGEIKEKGEFVVIISPNKNVDENIQVELSEIVEIIYKKVKNGEKKSEAIKNTAKEFNINKKEVYNLYHEKYD